jgi:two-component system, OmpR family, osmolarity sensor histidine kinase EnvZ
MNRLGFGGRVITFVFLALLLFLASSSAIVYLSEDQPFGISQKLPLAHQVAALVQLVERGDRETAELALKSANGTDVRVTLIQASDAMGDDDAVERLTLLEQAVRSVLPAPKTRHVDVFISKRIERGPVRRFLATFSARQQPATLQVSLVDGQILKFEVGTGVAWRILGVPTGFWIGLLGALAGTAALLGVWREARPIQNLSRSIAGFGTTIKVAPVVPKGAPDIRRLTEAFNTMQERIAGLMKGRLVLLAAISHDLRTYMTRLRLRAEYIEDQAQREKAIHDLEEMTLLVDTALAHARGVSASQDKARVDIHALLQEEVAHAVEAGRQVTLSRVSGPVMSTLDVMGMRRVFANLIKNAADYGQRCAIEIKRAGKTITIHFDDHGPGIPLMERELIFEPFYRLDTSRSRTTGGAGLGLAIVREIVEAEAGKVRAEDAPGGGARFTVTLNAN